MDWKIFFADPLNLVYIGLIIDVGIQSFYFIYFFQKLGSYKETTKKRSQTYPVSVIVCAKNEAKNLSDFLPGALLQKYGTTHEVVVINDNSTDDTGHVLKEFNRMFKQLEVVNLTQAAQFIPGKKYPLSIGIRSAKYEILLLTDADCLPATNKWIEKMQEQYTDGIEIVLGYSTFKKGKGLLNQLVRWEGFLTGMQYFSYALRGMPYMGVGRNLSYKRELFLKNKGFSSLTQVPGGDDDLFISKVATSDNVAIAIDPASFTITTAPRTWSEWVHQKKRHYSTAKYYKPRHQFLLTLYAISIFLFYPLALASFFFLSWKIVLPIVAIKMVLQYVVTYRCAGKLNEQKLALWTPLFDIWMFFYYIIFSLTPFKKVKRKW